MGPGSPEREKGGVATGRRGGRPRRKREARGGRPEQKKREVRSPGRVEGPDLLKPQPGAGRLRHIMGHDYCGFRPTKKFSPKYSNIYRPDHLMNRPYNNKRCIKII